MQDNKSLTKNFKTKTHTHCPLQIIHKPPNLAHSQHIVMQKGFIKLDWTSHLLHVCVCV